MIKSQNPTLKQIISLMTKAKIPTISTDQLGVKGIVNAFR